MLARAIKLSFDVEFAAVGPKRQQCIAIYHGRRGLGYGTLGYGPPGVYPGFHGFGLGYHPGYGYGGDALGVGADGGYPFYGGPGYPHCEPRLRRIGGITPSAYFGGPGYPSAEQPNYFGAVGPLVSDQPVIKLDTDHDGLIDGASYGPFTGALANPEALFSASTTRAAAGALPPRNSAPSSRRTCAMHAIESCTRSGSAASNR